jgi:hypothetical protein
MRSIFTLPGAAARAPNEQASDARQHHAAAKVRAPFRQPSNPLSKQKEKSRERWTRRRLDESPADDRRDSDFLPVAIATFHRAAIEAPADFSASNRCARLRAASLRLKGGVSVMRENSILAARSTGRAGHAQPWPACPLTLFITLITVPVEFARKSLNDAEDQPLARPVSHGCYAPVLAVVNRSEKCRKLVERKSNGLQTGFG